MLLSQVPPPRRCRADCHVDHGSRLDGARAPAARARQSARPTDRPRPLAREIGHGERKLCSLKGTGVCEDGREGGKNEGRGREGGRSGMDTGQGREREGEREGPIPRSVRQNLSSYETIFSQGELPFPRRRRRRRRGQAASRVSAVL